MNRKEKIKNETKLVWEWVGGSNQVLLMSLMFVVYLLIVWLVDGKDECGGSQRGTKVSRRGTKVDAVGAQIIRGDWDSKAHNLWAAWLPDDITSQSKQFDLR